MVVFNLKIFEFLKKNLKNQRFKFPKIQFFIKEINLDFKRR